MNKILTLLLMAVAVSGLLGASCKGGNNQEQKITIKIEADEYAPRKVSKPPERDKSEAHAVSRRAPLEQAKSVPEIVKDLLSAMESTKPSVQRIMEDSKVRELISAGDVQPLSDHMIENHLREISEIASVMEAKERTVVAKMLATHLIKRSSADAGRRGTNRRRVMPAQR